MEILLIAASSRFRSLGCIESSTNQCSSLLVLLSRNKPDKDFTGQPVGRSHHFMIDICIGNRSVEDSQKTITRPSEDPLKHLSLAKVCGCRILLCVECALYSVLKASRLDTWRQKPVNSVVVKVMCRYQKELYTDFFVYLYRMYRQRNVLIINQTISLLICSHAFSAAIITPICGFTVSGATILASTTCKFFIPMTVVLTSTQAPILQELLQ